MRIQTFLPENIVSNFDLEKEFPNWDYISFEKKIGIKQRHIAKDSETALDLGYQAAKNLLSKDDLENVDYLLFCTQSPDYFLPTSACILQDRLGLRTTIGALDINLGCSGYIYGLSLAKGLMSGGIANSVLLIVADTYSKHIHKRDRTNRSIFGDGAAATIIEKSDINNIGNFILGTDGSGYDKLIVRNGGFRNDSDPNSIEKVYGENNIYTDNELHMNGPDIFNFTIEKIPPTVFQCLKINNLSLDDIDFFIFHQANAYMLNFLRKRIKIPKEKFYIELSKTANTVSATIPIALSDAIINKKINKGDKVMLVGFGVGLSWGATIINI